MSSLSHAGNIFKPATNGLANGTDHDVLSTSELADAALILPSAEQVSEVVQEGNGEVQGEAGDASIYGAYPFLEGIPLEKVEVWIDQWRQASATEGGRTMTMLEFIDHWSQREDNDVVPGVFPRGEVITVASEAGGGKSWVGAHTFVTCVMGGRWWGRWQIPKLIPLYCLTENQKGWSGRLLAHLKDAGWKTGDRMGYVRNDLPRLFEQGMYNRNISGGYEWYLRIRADQYRGVLSEKLDVLFVDYLRDAAPGADEQSNNDMSLVMDGANQLARALQVLVLLFHHRGANSDKATRGATVVVDKSHAVFVLKGGKLGNAGIVTMEAAKNPKSMAQPKPFRLRLKNDSGSKPVVEFINDVGDTLVSEMYNLLRYTFPGKRLSLSQLMIELEQPDGIPTDAWKSRVNRAAQAIKKDPVKYPGIDYAPSRGGGYVFKA